MNPFFSIASSLRHDGDRIALFSVASAKESFAASAETWAATDEHLALAEALSQLSLARSATASWEIDGCKLEFSCPDDLGHVDVWVSIGTREAAAKPRQELAQFALRTDRSSIDSFVLELRAFVPGESNQGVLRCEAS